MGLGKGRSQDIAPPSMYSEIHDDSWCALKSCDKRFTPKTHNQKYCSTSCQQEVGKRAYRVGKKKANSRGMKCGKVSGSPPMRRVLALLKRKRQTTLEIQVKARVCNPATWVSALRKNGFNIICKYLGKTENGHRVYRYQFIKNSVWIEGVKKTEFESGEPRNPVHNIDDANALVEQLGSLRIKGAK